MRFKSNFTFGSLTAEDDNLLSTAYFDNGDLEAIKSPQDPRCFIIGRTGSGKSAALRHLEETYPSRILRVVPENLSFPYITNLSIVRDLTNLGVHLEPFFKALWKHVIVVEILKRRYGVTSEEKKINILTALKEKFIRDETKLKALDYLNEFGDKFWCETDERVKQIAETFEHKIRTSGGLNIKPMDVGLEATAGKEDVHTISQQRELANKYQRIVNETQLPRLNEMVTILNNSILDSDQHFTYLIIDDLDKQWVEEYLSNTLVRCLLETVMDLQKVRRLKVLVALRTNIFEQLGYEKISSGQEEKLLSKILHIRWTRQDLIGLLQTRAEAASKFYQMDPPKNLEEILPGGEGKRSGITPLDYILERTLMKPRDVIAYLNLCIREAAGSERMTWDDIQNVEIPYSSSRLTALRDEWKDPYIGIDKIFEQFQDARLRLSQKTIGNIFDNVALLAISDDFHGTTWLTPLCEKIWELDDVPENWFERYGKLLELLFNISFIGVGEYNQTKATYSYSQVKEERMRIAILRKAIFFEVHCSFRPALEIK